MKFLQILSLVVLICVFSFFVKAQADCRYGVKIFVLDEAGKAIKNAKIELAGLDNKSILPSYVKLITLDDAYLYTSSAGQTVNGNFQISISADGFENYRQKVNFPICKIQDFNIKLKSSTKKQNTSILSGTLYDAVGAVITNVKVTAISERGEKFEALTNDEGIYSVSLPFNDYDSKTSPANFRIAKFAIVIDLENRGFEKFVANDIKLIPAYSGKMFFDIALDSRNSEPCGYAGADCLETPVAEDTKQKVQNKILQKSSETLPKEQNKTKRKN